MVNIATTCLIFLLTAFFYKKAESQINGDSIAFLSGCEEEVKITPKAFDVLVTSQLGLFREMSSGTELDSLHALMASRILNRLRCGLFVSENAIMKTTNVLSAMEFQKNTNKVKYIKTVGFIDSTINMLYKQDYLRIKLLKKKSFLLVNSYAPSINEYDMAIRTYKEMLSLADSISLNDDVMLLQSKVEIADILYKKKGDKEEAAKYYRSVLQYPFYLIKDMDAFNKTRAAYIGAGRGSIEAYRGNLKALKELYFIPSTTHELYPLLKKYIEEVGGVWDRGTSEEALKKLRN